MLDQILNARCGQWAPTPTCAAAVLALLLGGCGSSNDQKDQVADSASSAICASGDQKACACPGGTQGAQRCYDDGRGWGECLGCSVVNPADSGTITTPPDAGMPS